MKRNSIFLAIALLIAALTLAGCSCSAQSSASSASGTASASASSSSSQSSASAQVQVPNLVRLELQDAEKLLANMGLSIGETKYAFDNDAPAGLVISQSPDALTMVDAGSAVTLTISKGKEAPAQVEMPNLLGKTQREAEQAIADAKLVAVQDNPIVTSDYKPGTVCKQSVEAGTKLPEGSQVSFATALAENTVKVPDVEGKSISEAKAELDKADLGHDTSSAYSDKVDKDDVISQSIPAGTKVAKGTVVTLRVSLGKKPVETVEVPNIYTFTLEDAIAALDSCGLKHRYTGEKNGTVVEVDPEPGTKVKPGSTVTFTLQHASSLVKVPDIAGKTAVQGAGLLDAIDLVLDYDKSNPDGELAGTDPTAGTLVDVGSTVEAVYKQDDTVEVPDVSNMSGTDAAAAMEAAGLSLDYDTDDPSKQLSGTDPAAGTKVKKGTTVKAEYPKPEKVKVPDVSGDAGKAAAAELKEAGLDLDYDKDHPDRLVKKTNPGAGESVDPGTTVEAIYDETVTVPDLAGMTGEDAKAACDKLGIDLDYDKNNPDRIITRTDPKAGKTVKPGDTVKAIYDDENDKGGNDKGDKGGKGDAGDDKGDAGDDNDNDSDNDDDSDDSSDAS